MLQDGEPPTTSVGQQVSPDLQHVAPQTIAHPPSLLPLLVPLSWCTAPSSPESAPPPPSVWEPLLLASVPLLPVIPSLLEASPLPLDVPLIPPLELLVILPLDALPAASLPPPPVLLTPVLPTPLLLVLAPLLARPLLLAAVFASVPSSEVVNAVPPHSGIASAIAIAPNAKPRLERTIASHSLQAERQSGLLSKPAVVGSERRRQVGQVSAGPYPP